VTTPDFQGLRVLVLESRRSRELAALVSTYGGRPLVAPALREIPLESNSEAMAFADRLIAGAFDLVVLLTGVGTRALLAVVDHVGRRDEFVAALARTRVAVRGPKPLAVLRELKIQSWVVAPEPNTWRELLAALDAKAGAARLQGLDVAVQEYGAPNLDLLQGLEARGARVTRVPVYRWALPEDIEPLRGAVRALTRNELDVAIFTTATQVVHLLQVAATMNLEDAVREGLSNVVVASIGPTTSQELREQGVTIDIEASHPKMGFLAREAAERSPGLRARKKSRDGRP
jgi:uroporphyrinogen-III synthase